MVIFDDYVNVYQRVVNLLFVKGIRMNYFHDVRETGIYDSMMVYDI